MKPITTSPLDAFLSAADFERILGRPLPPPRPNSMRVIVAGPEGLEVRDVPPEEYLKEIA